MESGCLLRVGDGRGMETPGGCTVAAALCPSLTHRLLTLAGLPLDLQYLPADKQREPEADIRKMLLEALLLVGGQVGWGEGTWGLLCAQETAKWALEAASSGLQSSAPSPPRSSGASQLFPTNPYELSLPLPPTKSASFVQLWKRGILCFLACILASTVLWTLMARGRPRRHRLGLLFPPPPKSLPHPTRLLDSFSGCGQEVRRLSALKKVTLQGTQRP